MQPDVRKKWTLVLCCLAQFMVILDVSIVNVALPSIQNDLGFSDVDLQWIVSAYTLTFAGFLLLGGRAADLLGARTMFVAGLALFGAASLAGGLSSGQAPLIIARAVQGLGGAVVAPVTLSILTMSFAEGAERNRALAAWGAMGAAGGAAGALVGGVLTELVGWQSILFINVPIAIGAALAARRVIDASVDEVTARADRHYDALGALTVTAGLVLLTFAIVRTDVNGWGSATTLGTMAGGLALLALFVAIEARFSKWPLVPLSIFSTRSVTASNLVVFFMGSAVFAMWYFVSRYLQQVLHYSAIEAGLAFLPMTGGIAVASTMAGRLSSRLGPGRVLSGGMALITLGLLGFSFVSADGSFLGDVLVPGVITAFGLGFSFVPVTIAATAGVERSRAGLASGLVNTSRQFGGSVGLAILATVASGAATGSSGAGLTHGFRVAFLVGAGFALLGALTSAGALSGIRRPVPEPA